MADISRCSNLAHTRDKELAQGIGLGLSNYVGGISNHALELEIRVSQRPVRVHNSVGYRKQIANKHEQVHSSRTNENLCNANYNIPPSILDLSRYPSITSFCCKPSRSRKQVLRHLDRSSPCRCWPGMDP